MCICSHCFSLLNKIRTFAERCQKAHKFLQFVSNLSESIDDLNPVRSQFGLTAEDLADRSTDRIGIDLEIKDEFIGSHNQGLSLKQTK